jgi:DNA-binding GntR family transcriptional regulator
MWPLLTDRPLRKADRRNGQAVVVGSQMCKIRAFVGGTAGLELEQIVYDADGKIVELQSHGARGDKRRPFSGFGGNASARAGRGSSCGYAR